MVILLLVLLPISVALGQVTYITVPNTDNGPAYVFADEGTLNVSLYCVVISNNSGTPVHLQSRWLFGAGAQIITFTGKVASSPASVAGNIIVEGEPIPDAPQLTFQTNLTILNFSRNVDLTLIRCGPQGSQLREFNLGFTGIKLASHLILTHLFILVLLSLLTPVSTQLVIEGNNITVNLTVGEAPTPFPPQYTSQWTHDGQPLLSNGSNDILLTEFVITLTSVQRNQSGNYTLTISNDAGSTTTSFILDVQCK